MRIPWVLSVLLVGCSAPLDVPWTGEPSVWWNESWSARLPLSVLSDVVDPDLTNTRMLVVLDPTRFDYARAQNGGEDLRFVDAVTGVELTYEIESWDPGGESNIWVDWPALDHDVYVYFENPNAGGVGGASLWDAFTSVWHFGSDPTADATGSGHSLTAIGNLPDQNEPFIGGALTLQHDAGWMEIASAEGFASLPVTVSCWIRTSEVDERRILRAAEAAPDQWVFTLEDPNGVLVFSNSSAEDDNRATTTSIADGEWHHVAAVSDADPSRIELYVDGEAVPTENHAMEGWFGFDPLPSLGGNGEAPNINALGATLDEVRVFPGQRTAAEIAVEYRTTNDVALDYGQIEDLVAPLE